ELPMSNVQLPMSIEVGTTEGKLKFDIGHWKLGVGHLGACTLSKTHKNLLDATNRLVTIEQLLLTTNT
ncbi:MAG TPA: hypothetical protein VIU13_05320, partial [Chryseolinea sp.]